MTNFEKAVEIVSTDLLGDIKDYRDNGYEIDSWSDMLDAFGQTSSDLKDDVRYVLVEASNDGTIAACFDDDLMIEDEDGTTKTYRQLTSAVRKVLFA